MLKMGSFLCRPIVKALAVGGLFTIVYYLSPASFYETNDDPYFRFLLAGEVIVNEPIPYTLHINYLLSRSYVCLYHLSGDIEWYGLSHLFFVGLSLFFLAYTLIKKDGSAQNLLMISVALVFLLVPFAVSIQFTKTAFLLSLAGFVGLTDALYDDDGVKKYAMLVVSSLLLCLGYMLRAQSFLLSLCLFAPILLLCLYRVWRKKQVVLVACVCGLITVLWAANYFQYTDEWATYSNAYFKTRSIVDFPIDYNENAVSFNSAGLSENDLVMMKNWGHIDQNKFNLQKLSHYDWEPSRAYNFSRSIRNIFNIDVRYYVLMSLVLMIMVAVVRRGFSREVFLIVLFAAFLLTVLVYKGRTPSRVTYCFFVSFPILLLVFGESRRCSKVVSSFFCIGLVGATFFYVKLCHKYESVNANYTSYRNGMEYSSIFVNTGPYRLLVWDGLFPFVAIKPYERAMPFSHEVIWLSQMNQSPIQIKMLELAGLSDLWRDIVDKSDVLITLDRNKMDLLRVYYRENYSKVVGFQKKWQDLPFYNIVTN